MTFHHVAARVIARRCRIGASRMPAQPCGPAGDQTGSLLGGPSGCCGLS
ncbi:hypothetical protein BURMUCF2_A0410 [Burkholderia multivorans CF2]|nr:hypothetical protein BURMUCF2_A0410 [Burkholderia multivorans CF2]